MNRTLKHLTLPELETELKNWEVAYDFDEISLDAIKNIRGKINAEIERRKKDENLNR